MTAPAAVLVVDDDALMLRAVQRSLYGLFDITTAISLKEAVAILDAGKPFAVIVSDLRMPGGDGVELLQFVRARYPDTVRVLLSGAVRLNDAISAVNDGQVFRLLTKPFELAALRRALYAAVEQNQLVLSERVLLEQTLQGSIKMLTDMLAIVQPMAFGRATRMRHHATELAARAGVRSRWDIEVAALLSQIGSVTLDADTLDRWYHSQELTPHERAQVERIPEVAETLIADIPRLETVRTMLRRQFEPFNSIALPIGAAILSIVRDFDVLVTGGNTGDQALATMTARGSRYGTELMNHFREMRATASAEIVEQMQLRHVGEAMTFSADVYSANGLLLIARGQRVTQALLSRLRMESFAAEASIPVDMIVHAVEPR